MALRSALVDELGGDRADGTTIGPLYPEPWFDNLRYRLHGGRRHVDAVTARLALADGELPDWAREYDRFDSDYRAVAAQGGPIEYWLHNPTLYFEPPQLAALPDVARRRRRSARWSGDRPAAGRGHLALRPDARVRRHRAGPRPRRAAQPGGHPGARCPPTARPPSPSATTSVPFAELPTHAALVRDTACGRVVPRSRAAVQVGRSHHGGLRARSARRADRARREAPRSRSLDLARWVAQRPDDRVGMMADPAFRVANGAYFVAFIGSAITLVALHERLAARSVATG